LIMCSPIVGLPALIRGKGFEVQEGKILIE